jgi:hypothetical protein
MAQSGYTPILIYASGTASAVPLAANMTSSASGAELALNYLDGKLYYKNSAGTVTLLASTAGASGDVVGPASATDNALARFDTTTGKLIQNSVGILSDAGVLTGLTGLTSSGNVTLSALTSGRVPYASTGGLLVDSANMTFNGTTLTVAGLSNTGNTILGDASADTVTVNGTITSNLIFTDNTYDIGASGATRPRTLYLGTSLITPSITNSGLSNGRVTFAGTGGLLSDSSLLTWNGSYFVANGLRISGADVGNTIYQATGNLAISLDGAGTNLLLKPNFGSVGINATPAAWLWPDSSTGALQLQAGAAFSAYNAGAVVSQNWYYNAGEKFIANGYASRYSQASGTHIWSVSSASNSSGAGAGLTWSEIARFSTSGQLSIGTTGTLNYGTRLSVLGTTNAGYGAEFYVPGSNNTTKIAFANDSSIAAIGSIVNNLVFYAPAATEVGRFTSAGNFLVGTSTSPTNGGGTIGATGNLYVGSMSQNINYGNGISIGNAGLGLLLQQSVNTNDERLYLTNNAQTSTTSGFTGGFTYNKTGATASAYYQVAGYHQFFSAPTGTAGSAITWTTVLSVAKDVTLSLQGGSQTLGTGIAFPATANLSSNANTLDDYEEGTFDVVLQNNAGTQTVTFSGAGKYTKIGRFISYQVNIYNSSVSAISAGDPLRLVSLPFSVGYYAANSFIGSYPSVPVSIVDGTGTTAPLYVPSNAIDYTFWTRNSWGGAATLTMRGQFMAME